MKPSHLSGLKAMCQVLGSGRGAPRRSSPLSDVGVGLQAQLGVCILHLPLEQEKSHVLKHESRRDTAQSGILGWGFLQTPGYAT